MSSGSNKRYREEQEAGEKEARETPSKKGFH
jgi:hypothetical protein